MDMDLPEPWVCQTTPPLFEFPCDASTTDKTASLTP